MAHCVDSLRAPHADPINMGPWPPRCPHAERQPAKVVESPAAVPGREQALLGARPRHAFRLGRLRAASQDLPILGGRYDLLHAPTHAVVLPYVLAFNGPGAPDAERRLARAFDAPTTLGRLQTLRLRLGAPQALRIRPRRVDDPRRRGGDPCRRCPTATLSTSPPADLERLLRQAWEELIGMTEEARAQPRLRGEAGRTCRRLVRGSPGRSPPAGHGGRRPAPACVPPGGALHRGRVEAGIDFTAVGHATNDRHVKEFVLLSDTLGASMQTIAVGHQAYGEVAEAAVLRPFFVDDAPYVGPGRRHRGRRERAALLGRRDYRRH